MPKKSAAHLKKVDEAVRILNTTTGLKLRQAMILAGFSKKDISDKSMCKMIRRRLEALGVKQRRHAPTVEVRIMITNDSVVSPLTGGDSNAPTASTTTETTGPTHPKPKRKQIRPTASAVQQRRVNDLAAKRHKSDAHKAAVRLFNAEKQKPDGMSIRQVYEAIMAKYETCPSIATISRYASKEELVGASPMKMGPVGHISATAYKFLCQAYKSLVPINQMSACTGHNSWAKMIPPHFQFQTPASSAEGEAICIEMICYFTPVKGIFGWETEQEYPISFGLNSKGGMDDDDIF